MNYLTGSSCKVYLPGTFEVPVLNSRLKYPVGLELSRECGEEVL